LNIKSNIIEKKNYDLVGTLVIQVNQTQNVNISALANGLYIVKYIFSNDTYNEKILKE